MRSSLILVSFITFLSFFDFVLCLYIDLLSIKRSLKKEEQKKEGAFKLILKEKSRQTRICIIIIIIMLKLS